MEKKIEFTEFKEDGTIFYVLYDYNLDPVGEPLLKIEFDQDKKGWDFHHAPDTVLSVDHLKELHLLLGELINK